MVMIPIYIQLECILYNQGTKKKNQAIAGTVDRIVQSVLFSSIARGFHDGGIGSDVNQNPETVQMTGSRTPSGIGLQHKGRQETASPRRLRLVTSIVDRNAGPSVRLYRDVN